MKSSRKTLVILLISFTIYLCFRNFQLNREVNSLSKAVIEVPDTVYSTKPFKPEKKFKDELIPEKIIIYRDRVSSRANADSFPVISRQDSLVQFILKDHKLQVSLFNQPTGTNSTRLFDIDLEKYNYNWYDGQLTQKRIRRLSIKPYIYGKYRPFNKLFDAGLGLSLKTNSFNYKLGINSFYYPRLRSGIGTDLEFSITYNF